MASEHQLARILKQQFENLLQCSNSSLNIEHCLVKQCTAQSYDLIAPKINELIKR